MPNGPTVWYLVKSEVMEIDMLANSMEDCVRAAETLGARFFVLHRGGLLGVEDTRWVVYDIKNPAGDPQYPGAVLANRKDMTMIRPVKQFETETADAPIMWALSVGATR